MALFMACGPALANAPGHHANFAAQNFTPTHATSALFTPAVTPTAGTLPIGHGAPGATHMVWQPTHTLNHLPGISNVELDLTSSKASIVLPSAVFINGAETTLSLGGVSTTFHVGDVVTAAEFVAINQNQAWGGQKLTLDAEGRATGGSFTLNRIFGANSPVQISGLVIPQNVTALDFVSGKQNISMSGDIQNYGSIIDIYRAPNAVANISATNIINETGASISTRGHGPNAGNMDLGFNASQEFINNGTIDASGSISLHAPQITNSGMIASHYGNINLAAPADSTLNVTNTGGTLSALQGAINLRDAAYTGTANSSITGGDLRSQQLNLFSGNGVANVNVNQLTGTVVSTGNAVHVQAATDVLTLGTQCLTGDPTYYNSDGNILINGNVSVVEDLTIIASGNITSTVAVTLLSANDGTNGKNITLIAGANVTGGKGQSTSTVPGGTIAAGSVSLTGVSDLGGSIDLSASKNLVISSAGATGGNVTLAAFALGPVNGKILFNDASKIDATGSAGTSGDVTILAGSAASGITINVGSVAIGGAKNVQIITAQPKIVNGPLVYDINGARTSGSIEADYSAITTGDIVTKSVVDGSSIRILAGGLADLASIGFGVTPGSTVTITASNIISRADIRSTAGLNMVSGGGIAFTSGNVLTGGTGDVTVISGAAYTNDALNVTVTGGSGASSTDISWSGAGAVSGANVSLIAFGSASAGQLLLNQTNFAPGAGGNLTFMSGFLGANGIQTTGSAKIDLSASKSNLIVSLSTPLATTPVVLSTVTPVLPANAFQGGALTPNGSFTFANKPAVNGGNITYIQDSPFNITTGNFVSSGILNNLTLYSGKGITLSTQIVSQGLALLTDNTITLQTGAATNSPNGLSMIAGHDIVTSGNITNIYTTTLVNGGDMAIVAGAKFSLLGSDITIKGASATGGKIDMLTGGTVNQISSEGQSGTGGSITMAAFTGSDNTGTITLPSATFITSSGDAGKSGAVTIVAGAAVGTAIQIGNILAGDFSNPINSASITLQSATPSTTVPAVFTTTGTQTAGAFSDANATGTNADIQTSDLTSPAGNITVLSSRNVRLGQVAINNTNDDSPVGTIKIVEHGTETLQIFSTTTPTGNNYTKRLAAGGIIGASGSISINNIDDGVSATGGIKLRDAVPIDVNGAYGGSISLETGKRAVDVIDLGVNRSFDLRGSAPDGTGGQISFIGYDVVWDAKATASLSINVNSQILSGDGGKITYMTYKDALLDLSNSNILQFTASSVSGQGGAGGTIIIQNGGSIVYDAAGGALQYGPSALSSGGNGGNLTLMAGTYNGAKAGNGNETLLVIGTITADGVGNGNNGGSVTLSSNSGIAFNVGLKTGNLNGVTGGISVKSGTGGKNGSISLTNQNGGITISTALTTVDSLTVLAQNNGSILVGDPLGNATTSKITLTADGVGSVTQVSTTDIITANKLSVTAGPGGQLGGKTALAVNTADITLSGGLLTNVTDSAPIIALTVGPAGTGQTGFTFTGSAANSSLDVKSAQSGGNVAIKAGTLHLDGDVLSNSPSGTVLITATVGDITSAKTDVSAAKSVTLSAPNGAIVVNSIGSVGNRADSITIAAKEDIILGTAGAENTVSLKVTSKAAGQGTIEIDGLLFVASPSGTITISGTNQIIADKSAISGGKQTTISLSNAGGDIALGALSSLGTLSVDSPDALSISNNVSANIIDLKSDGDMTITSLGSIQTLTSAGTISMISKTGSINSNASIAGGKTITLTAAKGGIKAPTIGDSSTGSITITALQKIENLFNVTASDSVAIKTTGSGSNADINFGNLSVLAPGAGKVTLTSGGSIAGGTILAGKSVTISSKDAVGVTVIGSNNPFTPLMPGTVSITATNSIFAGTVYATDSVTMKTTASSALNGNITSNGPIQALSPKGVISITATGTSNTALLSVGSDYSAGKSVTLSAPNGGISINGAGLNYPTGTVTLTAATQIVNGSIIALSKITETTTTKTGGAGITVGGLLNTTSGSIALTASKGGVTLLPGTDITANGATKSSKATVLIEAKDAVNGTVTIGKGANVATSGLGGSDVNIAVGAPAKGINPTPVPGGITVIGGGGANNAFFGGPNLVTNTGSTTITLKGANVIFSGTASKAISIDSATITADPPAALVPAVVQSPVISSSVVPSTMPSTTSFVVQANMPLLSSSGSMAPLSSSVGAAGVMSTVNQMSLPLQGFASFAAPATRWISETEITGGEIPVSLLREVSPHHELSNGSVLAMPKVDTTVHTAQGDVSVAANSLVLIMALRDGLAIYNFDDTRSGAVTVKAHGHSFVVRPGTSSVIVSQRVKSFAHVNPAQLLCYRRMIEQQLHNGMKAFHSEFSMLTAFAAIKPLKEIIGSTEKDTKQVGNHFLKTMAIMTQLQAGGESFKQVLRPQLTASAIHPASYY